MCFLSFTNISEFVRTPKSVWLLPPDSNLWKSCWPSNELQTVNHMPEHMSIKRSEVIRSYGIKDQAQRTLYNLTGRSHCSFVCHVVSCLSSEYNLSELSFVINALVVTQVTGASHQSGCPSDKCVSKCRFCREEIKSRTKDLHHELSNLSFIAITHVELNMS